MFVRKLINLSGLRFKQAIPLDPTPLQRTINKYSSEQSGQSAAGEDQIALTVGMVFILSGIARMPGNTQRMSTASSE